MIIKLVEGLVNDNNNLNLSFRVDIIIIIRTPGEKIVLLKLHVGTEGTERNFVVL